MCVYCLGQQRLFLGMWCCSCLLAAAIVVPSTSASSPPMLAAGLRSVLWFAIFLLSSGLFCSRLRLFSGVVTGLVALLFRLFGVLELCTLFIFWACGGSFGSC
jgi:hypothetical protein